MITEASFKNKRIKIKSCCEFMERDHEVHESRSKRKDERIKEEGIQGFLHPCHHHVSQAD